MPVEGAIAERIQGLMPVTWDALSRDRRYGDALLRTSIDTVKERVFGSVALPSLEVAYPMIVIDYVAKLCVIDLISPAIDFWLGHPYQVTVRAPDETQTYETRAENLRRLREDLLRETRGMEPIVGPLINFRRLTNAPRPAINTRNDEFLTPSHQEWPRPYRVTDRS